MNGQPIELLLKQLLLLDDKSLNNIYCLNKYYKNVMETHENYIYSRKIKKKFGNLNIVGPLKLNTKLYFYLLKEQNVNVNVNVNVSGSDFLKKIVKGTIIFRFIMYKKNVLEQSFLTELLYTIIMYGTNDYPLNIVKLLIENGADVNYKDMLYSSIYRRGYHISIELIKNGAKISRIDLTDILGYITCYPDLIITMIETSDIDIESRDLEGLNVLEAALKYNKNPILIEYLIENAIS